MAYNSPKSEDRSTGKRWGHGTCWSDDEIAFVRDNPGMTPKEISTALGRSRQSVYGIRNKIKAEVPAELPPVKEPGDYVELLHSYVAEDFELREIWLRWNGYASAVLLKKDKFEMVTMVCTAK